MKQSNLGSIWVTKKCLISVNIRYLKWKIVSEAFNHTLQIMKASFLKQPKMKMYKFWLSPHLKSLLPNVANGDKVGQYCSKLTLTFTQP